jgi:hypothetical protein
MEVPLVANTSRKSMSKRLNARSQCPESMDDQFPTATNTHVGSRCLDRTAADDLIILSCD